MSVSASPRPPSRLRPVLALQGCAAVLFALAQVGRLVPEESWGPVRPLDGLFSGGNVAVTLLLVLAGFMVVGELLDAAVAAPVVVLRRGGALLAPAVAAVVLICLAAVVVDAADDTDGATFETTGRSVLRVLSFRWNSWVRTEPGTGRADLTSLWFFSVLVQLMLVAVVLVLLLGRRPRVLAGLLLLAGAACIVGRVLYLADVGWYPVSLSTWTRADGFLLGGAAATLARVARPSPETASGLLGGATLVLCGAVPAAGMVTVDETFQVLVPAVAALGAVAAFAAARGAMPGTLVAELLAHDALAAIGRTWLLAVAWAPFISVTVARHIESRPVGLAPLVAAGATALAVLASAQALGWATTRLRAAWSPVAEGRRRAAAEVGSNDRGPGGQPPAQG